MKHALSNLQPNTLLKSIYFGGGTPSLALPTSIETIIKTIKENIKTVQDIEITLEANPTVSDSYMLKDTLEFISNRLHCF